MYSLAVLSFLVGVVSAGSSSKDDSTPSASIIPSGISSTCTKFLTDLDSNSQLQSCLKSINSATSALTSSSSDSAISTALSSLCSGDASSSCPSSLFRTQLTDMYTACQDDVSDTTVSLIYDTLYAAAPFKDAVCTQDTQGGYCVKTLTASQSSSGGLLAGLVSTAKTYLSSSLALASSYRKRGSSSSGVSFVNTPNITAFSEASLPFLFLTPSSPSATLCSTCAQKIMTAYVNFESSIPYASGITSSPMLGKQKDLWSAMSSGCGGGFSGSVVANAGAAPTANIQGSLSGATTVKVSGAAIAAVAVIATFASL